MVMVPSTITTTITTTTSSSSITIIIIIIFQQSPDVCRVVTPHTGTAVCTYTTVCATARTHNTVKTTSAPASFPVCVPLFDAPVSVSAGGPAPAAAAVAAVSSTRCA
jgi:hypothetical protein